MDKLRQQIQEAIRLPAMRVFWFSLPLWAMVLIGLAWLPAPWRYLGMIVLLVLGGLAFIQTGRAAALGPEVTREQNELRHIIFGLSDALIAYDPSFRIIFFNPAAEKLFRVTADQVVRQKIEPRDAQKPELQRLTQVIYPALAPVMAPRSEAGTYPEIIDLSFELPAMELRVATSLIRDESGNLIGFVKIVHDRTRELASIRSKNDFITVASHQLRTPITEIIWALEALASDSTLNPGAQTIIQATLGSSRELAKITEDLLSIAKIEEGHFGYQKEPLDLAALADKLMTQLLPLVQQAGLKLYFDRPKDPLPPAIADSQKLSIVINNLLENAVRYNIKDGEIIVKLEQLPDRPYQKLSVRDTGIGIPPQELDKIGQKFFRAENALKYETKGSGLGLFIVQSIIKAHGGEFSIQSEVNRGSIFSFTLPTDPKLAPSHEIPADL
ncbi:MAG: PAS domain-containing protein [Candidatus Liptonbacteria bacterium]|nr:PAS domain-containing protein [Candidatus Liptonbacteria bacterium]